MSIKKIQWIDNPSNICKTPNSDKINGYVNEIFKTITKGKTPCLIKAPQLIIPIGSPGAGKSTIMKFLVKEQSDVDYSNYVNFDSDKLLDYLPIGDTIKNIPDIKGKPTNVGYAFGWVECMENFANTNIFELLIKKILKANYNLIFNTHYFNIIIDAQYYGYFCILVYVLASKTTAKSRVKNRATELGRFFSLDYKNTFGWSKSKEKYLNTYREQAVWYSLWADRLELVKNNKNTQLKKKHFKIIVTHPVNNSKKLNNWKLHIKKIYNMIHDMETIS